MFEVAVEKVFSAAHALRDYHGQTEPIHGHNFRIRVLLEGAHLDRTGLLVDFLEVDAIMKDVVMRYDHLYLNEAPPFDTLNPSAENMAQYFHGQIAARLKEQPKDSQVRVAEVTIWETPEMRATYRPSP
jgi:6-pyruvoyltetrahydropterin/6-carboxytetrahydropterin synthase